MPYLQLIATQSLHPVYPIVQVLLHPLCRRTHHNEEASQGHFSKTPHAKCFTLPTKSDCTTRTRFTQKSWHSEFSTLVLESFQKWLEYPILGICRISSHQLPPYRVVYQLIFCFFLVFHYYSLLLLWVLFL